MTFATRYTITVALLASGAVFQVHDARCGGALVYQGQDLQEALQGHESPEVVAWAVPHLQSMEDVHTARREAFEAQDRSDRAFRKKLLQGEI